MIRLVKIFVILTGAVYLGLALHRDPGYILVAFHNWTLEFTVAVALAIVFILGIGFIYLLTFVKLVTDLPSRWQRWQDRRRIAQAKSKTEQGIIELSQGYWTDANNHLIEALPDTSMPLLNYLTAAQAAQALGNIGLREQYLAKAQSEIPKATLAIKLTQIQMQLTNKEWKAALVNLKSLQNFHPYHPQVVRLLMELYNQVEDWFSLIDLLPAIQQTQILSFHNFQTLQKKVYLDAMSNYIHHDMHGLDIFIKKMPKHLLKEPETVRIYCRYLIDQKKYDQAESYLKRMIKKYYDDDLLLLYSQLPGSLSTLQFAETLLKQHTHSSVLYYCLSELCRRQSLWGKARQYLEKSISIKPNYQAYRALGQLLESLGNEPEAYKAYRQGLLLIQDH